MWQRTVLNAMTVNQSTVRAAIGIHRTTVLRSGIPDQMFRCRKVTRLTHTTLANLQKTTISHRSITCYCSVNVLNSSSPLLYSHHLLLRYEAGELNAVTFNNESDIDEKGFGRIVRTSKGAIGKTFNTISAAVESPSGIRTDIFAMTRIGRISASYFK
jgi:hypothetical protein